MAGSGNPSGREESNHVGRVVRWDTGTGKDRSVEKMERKMRLLERAMSICDFSILGSNPSGVP